MTGRASDPSGTGLGRASQGSLGRQTRSRTSLGASSGGRVPRLCFASEPRPIEVSNALSRSLSRSGCLHPCEVGDTYRGIVAED